MKIFLTPEVTSLDSYFLLEKHRWDFTTNINDAKIIVLDRDVLYYNKLEVVNQCRSDQIKLIWLLETTQSVFDEFLEYIKNTNLYKESKLLIVHTNALYQTDPRFIYFDITFNRQKLYYTDYQTDLCLYKFWVQLLPKIAYSIGPIDKTYNENNKLFLFPARLRPQMMDHDQLKKKLKNFICDLNCPAYISNPTENGGLLPNGYETFSEELRTWLEGQLPIGGIVPISDHYYNTSYITLGIESDFISVDNFYVTEKYFDPFVKGNFTLMHGSYNQIKYLKEFYEFKFPDWIDYSYDSIKDDQKRFESYLNSVKQVSNLSISNMHELYLQDKHILDHNRNIFYQRPYDSVYDKINNSINILGW